MRKQLEDWTNGAFTNDSRVFDFKDVESHGISDYLTKVTNYVTKGPKDPDKLGISKQLYRKRLVAWLGDYHGSRT